jgi:GT2 family glycosyltransferase
MGAVLLNTSENRVRQIFGSAGCIDVIEEALPVLSIITVTWNGKRYVEECLLSLNQESRIPAEVIVIDNASTDGTPELVEHTFPRFTAIRNAQNLGFAKANNIGIRRSRGKYLCLINSDVIVPPDCLTMLYCYMESNPDVAVVGPQMLGLDSAVRRSTMRLPSLRNSFCRAVAADRWPFVSRLVGGQMMSDFRHDHTADVEVLNGWFWMIRREAVEQVGFLDERFFMYGEDMDWCRRFLDAGWRLTFYHGAHAVHYGGASSRVAPVRFYLEMQRANLQYWEKHHGLLAQFAYRSILIVHHVIRLAGHSVAFLALSKRRTVLSKKIKRSWALLVWMAGGSRQDFRAAD